MADYDVKSKVIAPNGSKTFVKTRKVTASSWPEAKSKVKSEVEADRSKVSRSYPDTQKKARVSYKGSTVTLKASNPKSGIIKKLTKANPSSGKVISSKSFTKSFTSKGSSGRVIGGNPARNSGGGRLYKLPDVLKLRDY